MAKTKRKKKFTPINITNAFIDDGIISRLGKEYYFVHPPQDLLSREYRGCGNGFVVIEKPTGLVLDMGYTENGKRIREQNIMMCDDAGTILRETKDKIKVRANFSCCTACLW